MSQTLVIRTPDAVSTTSRTFPKQGMFNLKITKNGVFDTVDLWFRTAMGGITLELAGASFQAAQQNVGIRSVPESPTVISGTTLALTAGNMQYMKIKLNEGVSVAYLRCSYTAKSSGALVTGGNIPGQAFVDYGKKPYIVTNMTRMFIKYPVLNNLTNWDVSSVTTFRDTFQDSKTFNQAIGDWDTSSVIDMGYMFSGTASFDQPIGNWDVSNVTTMQSMFYQASSFNQPIADWNVSKVTNTRSMFAQASSFNQPIGNWNVSNVTDMRSMFDWAATFNQPIGNWNISKVTDMTYMFSSASSFDQDLSSWPAKFNVNVKLGGFCINTRMSTANYDKFLNALWADINTTRPQAWASRTEPKVLVVSPSKYSAASVAARASLVSNGWTITDGGLAA